MSCRRTLYLLGGVETVRILFAIAMAAATVWSYFLPDIMKFPAPKLAKILMWHLPNPMLATSLLMIGAWFSYKFMTTRDLKFDVRAIATMELGYMFCILTMATGILFSKAQWGDWWNNDPRQTSFLLVLLIYAAYFALRGAITDDVKRAVNSGGYALAALLPVMFLTFVFPRIPSLAGLHPNDTITGGNIKGEYLYCLLTFMTLFTILAVWLYRIRVRAGLLELNLEDKKNGLESTVGDPGTAGVVRPVRVSHEG